MAVGWGAKCAKILLIIYNVIFLLTGLALIALGIWLLAWGEIGNLVKLTFDGRDSELFRNAAILLIAMGALILLVSILGFVGAIMEHVIILGVYIGLLVVIFCGEIAGGVLAIVFKDKIVYNLHDILSRNLEEQTKLGGDTYYHINNDTGFCATSDDGYLWDFVQIQFRCCGISTGATGYESNQFGQMCNGQLGNLQAPLSCCKFKNGSDFGDFHRDPDNQVAASQLVDCNEKYTDGCSDTIAHWLEKYAPVLIGIGIGFAMVQLFGLIFAVCLCVNVGDD